FGLDRSVIDHDGCTVADATQARGLEEELVPPIRQEKRERLGRRASWIEALRFLPRFRRAAVDRQQLPRDLRGTLIVGGLRGPFHSQLVCQSAPETRVTEVQT